MTAVNNNLGAFTPSFSVTPVNITSAAGTTSFIVKASQTTAQLTPLNSLPSSAIHPATSLVRRRFRSHPGLHASAHDPAPPTLAGLLAVVLSIAALTAAAAVETPRRPEVAQEVAPAATTNAQSGTYTFTITAVSGTLVHSTGDGQSPITRLSFVRSGRATNARPFP